MRVEEVLNTYPGIIRTPSQFLQCLGFTKMYVIKKKKKFSRIWWKRQFSEVNSIAAGNKNQIQYNQEMNDF